MARMLRRRRLGLQPASAGPRTWHTGVDQALSFVRCGRLGLYRYRGTPTRRSPYVLRARSSALT